MNMTVNTRNVVLDILTEIYEKEGFTHIVLSDALEKYQYLDNMDRSFISRTVLGTVERTITIDYILNQFSKTKTNKMKPVIRNILRMSVYQLVYMEGVKDFAVCNEAVKLANKRGFATLKGFVNGVLRNIAREKENISFPDKKDKKNYLSITYSTPDWIVEKWLKEYDFEITEQILKAQFIDRPLTIRVNEKKISKKELTERLTKQNITVEAELPISEAMAISDYDYLDKIPEFREGLFFVQDLSSMLVSHILNPKGNEYIVDVCAAPGGKSLHLAEKLVGTGIVDSRDVSDKKVALINENVERLGLKNIKTKVWDGRVTDESVLKKADIVVADVPCSGLGILNKKPDIKYNASLEKCKEICSLQKEIVKASVNYVKAGGVFLYSTCTINPEENRMNAEWIKKEFDFESIDLKERLPEIFHSYIDNSGNLQLLPDEKNNFDGFFIAGFVRK